MNYQPICLSQTQIRQFQTDGFLIVENFVPADFAQRLASRMEPLFRGETARFHPTNQAGYIYGRYKRLGSTEMDESFFPILWQKAGGRSPHLADYCADPLASSAAVLA
ncbi:hypothetical protein [Leptolyngbya sp. BC1307]|uniref:hypothetical protein n=1 Tax=Leptolyngbya sp. BC1307 TaxID=2029589 RepID=UPI000EFB4FF5|nr:hypothetical protein [Leptolyngbya sp. BC1307]